MFFDHFAHTSRFAKLDIIFIAGDIFDTLLYFKHPSVVCVLEFFRRLMRFCKAHGIALRILEGTPSHDYKQSINLQPLADTFGAELDYKYVQSLSIEHMVNLNLKVLYVPDEWGGSAEECHRQLEILLQEEGLDQVDIGIMHGMFEYQIPDAGKDPLIHNSEYYLSIVKYFINIGHVHTASVMLRILAQGSFDRLAHGQEEKKGAIQVNLKLNGEHSFEFIENKEAMTFKTFEIPDTDLEVATAKLYSKVESLPDHSHVRVRAPKGSPIFTVMDFFKKEYPYITFKKDAVDEKDAKKDQLQELINLDTEYTPVYLPKDAIVGMILKEVCSSDPISARDLEELTAELENLHV